MRFSPLIERILEILREGAANTADLLDAMTSGYSESYRKLRRAAYYPRRSKSNRPVKYRESQKFYSLLYNLKKQGLIEKKNESRNSVWQIKPAGLEKLNEIKKNKIFSVSSINYQSEPDNLKIITFDIPIRENHKRYWLRASLKALGFEMLQKSVWVGKKKIPEDFLKDLRERRMLDYVHIFAVSKTGSLREIK